MIATPYPRTYLNPKSESQKFGLLLLLVLLGGAQPVIPNANLPILCFMFMNIMAWAPQVKSLSFCHKYQRGLLLLLTK